MTFTSLEKLIRQEVRKVVENLERSFTLYEEEPSDSTSAPADTPAPAETPAPAAEEKPAKDKPADEKPAEDKQALGYGKALLQVCF